jgi:integrase
LFAWCVREDELDVSPMANVRPPKVPEPRTQMLTAAQTKALLAGCAGRDFVSRRDVAIILLLADTGMRRSELAGLAVDVLDLRGRVVEVTGKGDREHRKRYRLVPTLTTAHRRRPGRGSRADRSGRKRRRQREPRLRLSRRRGTGTLPTGDRCVPLVAWW